MLLEKELRQAISISIESVFSLPIDVNELILQITRKEFEGDLTLTVFGLAKKVKLDPMKFGDMLGNDLVQKNEWIKSFTIIKGFLNIRFSDLKIIELFRSKRMNGICTIPDVEKRNIMIEYSSPNTNKPIHLGHMRNNLIGYSVSEILKAAGNQVMKVNLINDRGIHICKSMIAWQEYGHGETPESSGIKGDHLVGKYYVMFDTVHKEQVKALTSSGISQDEAEKSTDILNKAKLLLQKWEAGDKPTMQLWKTMNDWVYSGFQETYQKMGVDFDKIYYESQTYLDGKKIVSKGLSSQVFYKKEDGSVWVDLSDEGLDHKLLLRSDGTSVYITQDLGTALQRMEEFNPQQMIYVVGNEQDYHFKVLKMIMKKMGYAWWDSIFHLSYNMVDLPSGKMKSREGTVVDADDLMDEMIAQAKESSKQLGKIDDLSQEQAEELYKTIAMGALKFFILKVDSDKRMLFNPEDSIDLNGHTGPFIQYSYARIRSVLRKADQMEVFKNRKEPCDIDSSNMSELERELIIKILDYRETILEAAKQLKPSVTAQYVYDLAKSFNRFYHEYSILDESDVKTSLYRLSICTDCSVLIKQCMKLLGINVPERM